MSRNFIGFSKNKTAVIALVLLLTLSMTASMTLVPSAHSSNTIPTYAYINVEPNPTGVGQEVFIIMWVQVIFGGNAQLNNDYRFGAGTPAWTLVITAPDGTNTTTTLGVVTSPTSTYNQVFTPTATGTYTLTFNFPETTVTSSNDPTSTLIGSTYTAATASTTLTVQETPVAALPQTPLPTAYWTRPIYGLNSAWYTLGSNWLGFGSPGYIPNGGGPNLGGNGAMFGPTTNVGPLTGHIMWTMPLAPGGIVGQTATTIPGNSYAEGSAYDQKFQNPIIVAGMLIFTEPISQTKPTGGPTVCVNLQTGKTIWTSTTTGTPNNPVPPISFAYVYDAEDPNQHGVWPPMLVASSRGTWQVYDAFTGDALFNVTNVPTSGTTMLGPNGEYLAASLVNYGSRTSPNWYLQEWNSSLLWDNLYSGPSTTPTLPPPITNGTNPALYDFNVSLPWLNTETLNGAPISSITVSAGIQGNILLARAGNYPSAGQNSFFGVQSSTPYTYYGIGLNTTSGTLGTKLWSNTLQPPSGNLTVLWAGIDPVNNVFVENLRETMQFVGYSLGTGQKIWGPTVGQPSLDYYGSMGSGSLADTIAYGNIYSSAYAGIVYCYSTATGDILWTFGNGPVGSNNSTDSGVETPFGHYPTFVSAIGSGVVYTITTEHTEETPIFKGALARALNATTGEQIWTVSDYTGEFLTGSYAIADGYATFFNGYDNQVYVIGRGPSSTTVQAPQTAITAGSQVVIQGTVTDRSTGTTQDQQAGNFPNGVPVSSDASMSDWMGYVYQQQPLPTNFTGVTVTLTAVDPNNNLVTLGTATTNENGFYHLAWTPPSVPGSYLVTATFSGTNGYWGSNAQTAMVVQSAAASPTPATGAPSSMTDTYVLASAVAIIIVVIIIGLAIILTQRKRP